MPKSDKTTAVEFLATARKRFQQAADDEKMLRDEALIDLKYVAGDQWDPALKQQRERAGRPALTFPRCHTFVQQVSNEARQNKPQIKFAPGDDRADKDTADVLEGMARAIQYAGDAQIAYETAVECSAGGSFGYFRFLTEENEDGEQELTIAQVLDPFAVYGILVPACFHREPRFGFVVEDIPREEFEGMYPDSAISKDAGFDDGGKAAGWVGTDTVRVAEYWYCEDAKIEGTSKKQTKVHFCKITWAEELPDSRTEWLDYCIPIIPVLGKLMVIQGKAHLFSVVRHQRSAQQMLNYTKSRIAETLATAPISPFMVARGQIPKGDKKWENLNTQVFPYLEYDTVDVQGKPAERPQRDTFEPPIASLSSFAAQEIDDMKAVTGIFDASMGARSNETSGTAITRRQQQANMTTMHFMDNLERAFKKGGGILRRLIPQIYDGDRMVRVLGADEMPKIVRINMEHVPQDGQQSKHYKVGGDDAGKYHEIVTMGRAFATKREETFDMLQQLTQSAPNLLPMFGDVMFQNADVAGADIVAERFKKMLPPNLQENDGDPASRAQSLQAQLAQAQQLIQAGAAHIQQLQQEREGKVIETTARKETEMFKAQKEFELKALQLQTQRDIAEITTKAQDARERAKLDADLDDRLHTSAHEAGLQAQEQVHKREMAQRQAQIASQQATQAHAQTLETQQQAAALQPSAAEPSQ